jgi:hypothetical protein
MTIGQDDQGGQEEGQDAPDDPEPHSEGAPIEFAQSNFHLEHLPEPPLIKILGESREKHIEQDRQSQVSEIHRRQGAHKPKLVETPGIKGKAIARATAKPVRDWNKGILSLRIIWMTSDWEAMLSMNQPVWKSAMKRPLSHSASPKDHRYKAGRSRNTSRVSQPVENDCWSGPSKA